MDFIITLLAHPDKEHLTQAFVDSMPPSLALQDVVVIKTQWLEAGIACDLCVKHPDIDALRTHVQDIIQDHPYDAVVQPVAGRRKKLLISDMDSTMITVECIDELADFVGKKTEVAAITERAMNGELNFEAALTERVLLLKDLPIAALQECYDQRVKMMPGAKQLVQTMRNNGAHTILVSGGFTFFTSRVKDALGFHEDHSNQLEIQYGMLTGRVILPILGKEAKLTTLKKTCEKLGITESEVLAIGDGANDLPMLLAAGLGVAYHAKPIVRAQTNARLNICDLSALLYVQGYSAGF
jgi:phosphoserine phosphatase